MGQQKQKGTDILFLADVDGVLTAIGGQQDCNVSVNGESIDASTKDSDQWVEGMVGRSDWSADGESIVMIDPDAEQLEPAVRELFLSLAEGTKIDVEISLPGNVTFSGRAIVASLDFGAPDNDAATSSWEVEGDGPLTLTEGGIAAN